MNRYNTPFRYPGGKQKLSPFVLELMLENGLAGGEYAEPYAGGAGVAMELLLSGNATRVHLNDACKGVYSFWKAVTTQPTALCRKISLASLNVGEWRRQQKIMAQPEKHDLVEVGFSALYLNRCNRSGILSGGLIGGLHQTGKWTMDVRFPRNEIIRRIEAIAQHASKVKVTNLDAEEYISDYIPQLSSGTFVYLDPPYYGQGSRLYLNHYQPKDHARLAKVVQSKLRRPWIVSYDAVRPIAKCYGERRALRYDLQYNAADAYVGREVIFFSDQLNLPKRSAHDGVDCALRRKPRSLRR